MEAIIFKNFTSTDFKWKCDGIEHSFPAGMEIYLEKAKAEHFAKHLVDREMNTMNVPTDRKSIRDELTAKCFPVAKTIAPLEALQINEKAKTKKGKKVEPEFEDLDN